MIPGDPSADIDVDEATPTSKAVREVEEQMSVLAARVRASIRNAAATIDPTLQPFGLRVLRIVERCGPIHAGATAEHLSVDRTVVSRQIRQLEDLGLITTRFDPADRRARFLELTDEGRERLAIAGPVGARSLHRALSGWSDDDLHRFAGYLARLVDDSDRAEADRLEEERTSGS